MKDVIERMLRVEEEARKALADADREAAQVAEAARREAVEKTDALKLATHAEATKRLEARRAELQKRRDERLAACDATDAAWSATVQPRIPDAVERIVKRVVGS